MGTKWKDRLEEGVVWLRLSHKESGREVFLARAPDGAGWSRIGGYVAHYTLAEWYYRYQSDEGWHVTAQLGATEW